MPHADHQEDSHPRVADRPLAQIHQRPALERPSRAERSPPEPALGGDGARELLHVEPIRHEVLVLREPRRHVEPLFGRDVVLPGPSSNASEMRPAVGASGCASARQVDLSNIPAAIKASTTSSLSAKRQRHAG